MIIILTTGVQKAFDFALVGTSLPSSTCTFLGVQVLLLACHISKELS
jgi:hypothetical protein